MDRPAAFFFSFFLCVLVSCVLTWAGEQNGFIDLGLSSHDYQQGRAPSDWKLRKRFGVSKGASAAWVHENDIYAVKLHSTGELTFLEKTVDIDISAFPVVAWRWKVEKMPEGVDERTPAGDDHPIRIFFVFEPDVSKQSFWFRVKRFLYLDRVHGHSVGSRYTEYLWSSHLQPGDVINDPSNPEQKLMVIEGGRDRLGQWLLYQRNLYQDFKLLYGEEPRRLIMLGILNDTDQTGQEAVSYIADLGFHRQGPQQPPSGSAIMEQPASGKRGALP